MIFKREKINLILDKLAKRQSLFFRIRYSKLLSGNRIRFFLSRSLFLILIPYFLFSYARSLYLEKTLLQNFHSVEKTFSIAFPNSDVKFSNYKIKKDSFYISSIKLIGGDTDWFGLIHLNAISIPIASLNKSEFPERISCSIKDANLVIHSFENFINYIDSSFLNSPFDFNFLNMNISCKSFYGEKMTMRDTSLKLEKAENAWNAKFQGGNFFLKKFLRNVPINEFSIFRFSNENKANISINMGADNAISADLSLKENQVMGDFLLDSLDIAHFEKNDLTQNLKGKVSGNGKLHFSDNDENLLKAHFKLNSKNPLFLRGVLPQFLSALSTDAFYQISFFGTFNFLTNQDSVQLSEINLEAKAGIHSLFLESEIQFKKEEIIDKYEEFSNKLLQSKDFLKIDSGDFLVLNGKLHFYCPLEMFTENSFNLVQKYLFLDENNTDKVWLKLPLENQLYRELGKKQIGMLRGF